MTIPTITRCARCHKTKYNAGRLCAKCARFDAVKCAKCKKVRAERDSIFCKPCGEAFRKESEQPHEREPLESLFIKQDVPR